MLVDIKIPSPGESITEVEIGNWFIEDGDYIEKDQEIGEIESDKATLPLIAEESGTVTFKASPGDTINVGDVACVIDTEGVGEKSSDETTAEKNNTEVKKEELATNKQKEEKKPEPKDIPATKENEAHKKVKVSPLAKQVMQELGLTLDDVLNGIKRISKSTVEAVANLPEDASTGVSVSPSGFKTQSVSRNEDRERMSQLRRKIAKRLVTVKNETAMLTTFNEVDMSAVMNLRNTFQKKFVDKHGVKLGFMSFFTKAAAIALQKFPKVNSMIDGEEMITPGYYDIGIAVQTDKGLMVPVLRNVETMGLAEIEKAIIDKATLARKGRLPLEDMTGGTFTITNGGIFGSMLSTPIINPPQSGILGMHNIVERPVAVDGQVVIRPIMYLALSYDHRIIDGRDSVSFLKTVKELIENPTQMLLGGGSPEGLLLEI